ncbi:hypothetical protein LTS18_005770 [Coniosporium uncinatum]|uniref:Uncharacterized protein n=1 Tax=Coniosporium uncinatum TaxID=93489 RepID=A0ACC3DB36_9PEZI|nr:hypothetical protein LTS18_005770 [Coniosporium uncinatum]
MPTENTDMEKVVVRVLAAGCSDRWIDDDAYATKSEVLTMKYVKRKLPNFPIPEILGYDVGHENKIEHPFIIMTVLEGERMFEAWQGLPEEVEDQRQNILRSLAKHMLDLQQLSFDVAGLLLFRTELDDGPAVGPAFRASEGYDKEGGLIHHTWFEGQCTDTQTHFLEQVEKMPGRATEDEHNPTTYVHSGMTIMTDIIIKALPPSLQSVNDPKETFVLAPPDFDWQNILVDSMSNVTSIID